MATNHHDTILSTLNLTEKLALCEAWKKSNLSRSEFIRQHNLPQSFHYWCNKLLTNNFALKTTKVNSNATEHIRQQKSETSMPNNNDSASSGTSWVQIVPKYKQTELQSCPDISHYSDLIKAEIIVNGIKVILHLPFLQTTSFIKELNNAAPTIR